ncbi:hypothetical protein BJF83_05175 [Nocardiopsis sp. CNR-923]|nr:hypothetical protein BJF83_05175 [Nocardiopsis sp. CNR-923]
MDPRDTPRMADEHDPRIAAFHRDFPGWTAWEANGSWRALRVDGRDGLVGLTATSLTELRMRLAEALRVAS